MDRQRFDKLVRLLLRTFPLSIIPGPEIYDFVTDLSRTRSDLDKKVLEVHEALQKAAAVVSDLETDLKDRTAHLARLRSEAERLSALAEIEQQKVLPLLKELDAVLNKGRSRERWIALGLNILAGALFFFLGVYVGSKLSLQKDSAPARTFTVSFRVTPTVPPAPQSSNPAAR